MLLVILPSNCSTTFMMPTSILARFYTLNEDCFAFNLKLLFLVGLWPKDDFTNNQRLMYKMYEIVLHVLTLILLIVTGIGTYGCRNDLTLVLANLDMTLVMYNFYFKMTIFLFKRDQLKTLIEDIENSGDTVTERSKKLMISAVLIITGFSFLVLGAFSVLALYNGEMTVEAWMPFDPFKSRTHLTIAAQILDIMFLPGLLRAFAMQGIVCSIVMYLCDQIIDLQTTIKELKYSEETAMETRKKFKEAIKKHIRLMRYAKTMKDIFKEYFLVQNLAVTLELCLNAVMVTVVADITLLLSFLLYLSLALINAYIYCYLGNELILQSQGIALACYEAPWSSWPLDMQKDLLIIITVAQKPLALSAGGIALVSLKNFGKTLYDGYSIFAVLNDMVD